MGESHDPNELAGVAQDIAPLAWVIDEIRSSLNHALAGVRTFLANKQDVDALRAARNQVHQTNGALQLLDLRGVSLMTEALERLLRQWEDQPKLCQPQAARSVETAVAAVLAYLDGLLSGRPNQPIRLFPYYRDVLQLTGAARIHPADLVFPDLSRRPALHQIETRPLTPELLRGRRARYEEGLLGFLRNSEDPRARRQMRDALADLEHLPARGIARSFWWVVRGLLDAIDAHQLPVDIDLKRVLARLNLQLRRLIDDGGAVAERLMTDTLYYVGRADERVPRVVEIKRLYGLDALMPPDFDRPTLTAIDPEALRRLKEAMAQAKPLWIQQSSAATPDLGKFVQELRIARDAAAALGAAPLVLVLDRLVALGSDRSQLGPAAREALGIEVASALLFVELGVDDLPALDPEYQGRAQAVVGRLDAAQRGLTLPEGGPWESELARRAQDRLTMGAVVAETKATLREIEQRLDRFFRNPAERGELAETSPMFDQIRGVLSMLGHEEPVAALRGVQKAVAGFVDPAVPPQPDEFVRIAQNLGALGFFVETLDQDAERPRAMFRYDPVSGVFSADLGQQVAKPDEREPDLPLSVATPVVAPPPPVTPHGFGFPPPVAPAPAAAPAVIQEPPARSENLESKVSERLALAHLLSRRLLQVPTDVGTRQALTAMLPLLDNEAELLDDAVLKAKVGQARQALAQLIATPTADIARRLVDVFAPPAEPPAPGLTAPLPSTQAATDRELLDIFVDEAREVLATIEAGLADVRRAPDDSNALTSVRRAFHTLKGSSRMVGLKAFGDGAWALEQCFNLWLAQGRPATEDLIELAAAAQRLMRNWIQQVEANPHAAPDVAPLIHAAQYVREGGAFVYGGVLPPLPRAPDPKGDGSTAGKSAPVLPADDLAPVPFLSDPATAFAPPVAAPPEPAPAEPATTAAEEDAEALFHFDLMQPAEAPPADAAAGSGTNSTTGSSTGSVKSGAEDLSAAPAPDGDGDSLPLDDDSLALDDEPLPTLRDFGADLLDDSTASGEDSISDLDGGPPPFESAETPFDPLPPLDFASVDDLTPSPGFEAESKPKPEAAYPPDPEPAPPARFAAPFDTADLAAPVFVPKAADPASGPLQAPGSPPVGMQAAPATLAPEVPAPLPQPSEPQLAKPAESVAAPLPSPETDEPVSPSRGDEMRRIGPIEISHGLYSVFLAEADECVRTLLQDVSEWRYEAARAPSHNASRRAHSLAGISATVGLRPVWNLADPLDDLLTELARNEVADDSFEVEARPRLTAPQFDVLERVVERIRGMLHVFAAGLYPNDAPLEAGAIQDMLRVVRAQHAWRSSSRDRALGLAPAIEPVETVEPAEPSPAARAAAVMAATPPPPDTIPASSSLPEDVLAMLGDLDLNLDPAAPEVSPEVESAAPPASPIVAEERAPSDLPSISLPPEPSAPTEARAEEVDTPSATVPYDAAEPAGDLLGHGLLDPQLDPALFDLLRTDGSSIGDGERDSFHGRDDEATAIDLPLLDGLPDEPPPQIPAAFGAALLTSVPPLDAEPTESEQAPVDLPEISEIPESRLPRAVVIPLPRAYQMPANTPAHAPLDSATPLDGGPRTQQPAGNDALGAGEAPALPADFESPDEPPASPWVQAPARALAEPDFDGDYDLDAASADEAPMREARPPSTIDLAVARLSSTGMSQAEGEIEPPAKTLSERLAASFAAVQLAQATPAAGVAASAVEAAPPVRDELDPDLLPIFVTEAQDLLPVIGTQLRALAGNPNDREVARDLMRRLHTVKGSARMAGAMSLGDQVHEMEARIESAMQLANVPSVIVDDLQTQFDHVLSRFEGLQAMPPQQAAAPTPDDGAEASGAPQVSPAFESRAPAEAMPGAALAAPTGATGPAPFVRVRADVLDKLVDHAGEVAISRSKLENEVGTLRTALGDLTENIGRLRTQLREVEIQADAQIQARADQLSKESAAFDPLEFDRYSRLQELTRLLAESVEDVAMVQSSMTRDLQSADNDLTAQSRLTRDLQQQLMRVRLVPFSNVAERLYRVARQTSKEVGKRINLEIRGGATEIDRTVLERMAAPFEHLVRNSIVHGLETPLDRLSAGKPEVGEVLLEVAQHGNEIVVVYSDDGAGLNLERIRSRGIEKHLIGPQQNVGERELIELIFAPGFSTATEVTELAGRGVGMDVVRSELASFGGRIAVATEAGRGARFTLYLPLTLSVTQVVLATVGQRRFAIPAGMVEQVKRFRPAWVEAALRDGLVEVAPYGRIVVRPLAQLLGEDLPVSFGKQTPIAVLRSGEDRLAVAADELSSNQEVVVKNVGPQVSRLAGLLGATILGTGEIVLIVNPVQLIARAPEPPVFPGAGLLADGDEVDGRVIDAGATILVVDDSLTVRRVTQRLLERQGYTVTLAKDGVDALRRIQETRPDLMLVDIEMPRMDGFDLTRNIRANAATRAIPIIIITSRTAEKHRRVAFEIGVNEYLGKPYRDEELLELIRRYLGLRTPA